jgi:hypothetical protein
MLEYAMRYLRLRADACDGRRAPCVFDIDLTVLRDNGRPMADVARFVRRLMRRVPVYFVTARMYSPDADAYTRQQLADAGLDGYHGLYLLPRHEDPSAFKTRIRREVASKHDGLGCQLAVGDTWWDCLRTPVRHKFRHLPRAPRSIGHIVWDEGAGELGLWLPYDPQSSGHHK